MSIKKIILFISVFLLIIGALGSGAYFYIKAEIAKPLDRFGVYKDFKIFQGESVSRISQDLADEDIIKNSLYFRLYVWREGIAKSIQAGEYNLSGGMNIIQIADIITQGKVVDREATVLIPEGLTIGEIENILAGKNLLEKGDFVAATGSAEAQKYYGSFDFFGGKPNASNLEGYIFPDTYKFYIDAKPEDMIRKILANFGAKFDSEMRAEANRQGKSIYEILTLASIVQAESSGPDDMKIIAGIFENRLAIGKALEADSTINFITGKKMRQASFKDLEINSPYNTYKYAGLPPGPIDNPGLDAIKAVIWPQKTDYLYFLHTPEGQTIYSKTYQEHLKNKAKYLK